MTFRQLREQSFTYLRKKHKDVAAYHWLVSHYAKVNKNTLLNWNNKEVTFDAACFWLDLKKYVEGTSIQRIVGTVRFANVIVNLQRKVFTPRWETEELVTKITRAIKGHHKVLDLGCGSGCIGLALKKANPNLTVTLADVNPNAVWQSRQNSTLNNLAVKVVKSCFFKNIKEQFDLVICNPPYLSGPHEASVEVTLNDPHTALFEKENGLAFYRRLAGEVRNHLTLKPGLKIALEIPFQHEQVISKMFAKLNFCTEVKLDMTGKARFIFCFLKLNLGKNLKQNSVKRKKFI